MKPVTSIRTMHRRTAILLLAAALAFGVSACGGSQPNGLDRTDANEMLAELDQVRSFLDAGSCISAGSHAVTLLSQVQALPADTDPDLRRALENGAQNLTVLLDDPANCELPAPTTTTTPGTTTTTPSTTTTVPPTTTTVPPTTTDSGSGGVSP